MEIVSQTGMKVLCYAEIIVMIKVSLDEESPARKKILSIDGQAGVTISNQCN